MNDKKVEWTGHNFAACGDDLTAEIDRVRSGGGTLVYQVVIYNKDKFVERHMRMNLADAKKAAKALLLDRA